MFMNDLIDIAKGFQTSINIAYDLNNDDKVKGFIPTMSSLDVIEDVLLSTVASSTQRARILIGAYGRGKSHIVLVLMSLLFKKDISLFDGLLAKMKTNNKALYDFAVEYLNSEKKILPIIVRGSSTSLTQSFLSALQQTLSEEGFSDLMPETHFKAAANQIENWRDNYPDTYRSFKASISKSIGDFILSLNEYDVKAYEEFAALYPELTSGSVFNPFLGFDIVELYESITDKLKDRGFSGIYVIYDEFSKYLESSISTATNSDIKLLQDFAEKCDRSGNKQMHLMLISHKDIANYIDSNLPKDKVDGWRGVSGRFKHINLHNNYSQMYEIISAVIRKNPAKWQAYKEKHQSRFEDLKDRFTKNSLLDKNNIDEINNGVEGCYPLHPISTFILPRLSEKVAQNERTLFTFLSSEDKFTLSAFIKSAKGDFPMLTPDFIYDYFEPLFRKEPYTSEAYKMYKLTSSVLRKVEDLSLHSKIIKTIALIYIVEQFEILAPIMNVIMDTFRDTVENPKQIDDALTELIDKDCIVYLKRSNGYLKIKETSGVDIREEIKKYIQLRLTDTSITDILNHSSFDNYMYPTAYNDEHEIIRYFDFTFMNSEDFWSVSGWDQRVSSSNADGVVYAIIPKNQQEIKKIKDALVKEKEPHSRIVFVVPNNYIDIQKDILDYKAVTHLKSEVIEDDLLSDEYDIYIDDLSEVVVSFINSYTRPENGSASYYYNGQRYNFHRKAQLSNLLSEICNRIFYRTPIINNESVNKNVLPTVAINSRSKILSGLLANELAPNIGLSGSGQDVSIMRSTLIQTGILENIDTNPAINIEPADELIRGMLHEIKLFFTEQAASQGGANFKTLYDTLTLHQYGFGLKYGIIPIYIAAVLHLYKKNLVILYNGNETKITADLLNDINESPEDYSVILEDWNKDKTEYMSQLEALFKEYVVEREKDFNSFTYLLSAMERWYLSLPKYAKEMTVVYKADGKSKKIDKAKKKFMSSLRQLNINPREFLFDKIFTIFGMSEFSVNVVDMIAATKTDYDNAVNYLITELSVAVKTMFTNGNIGSSLTSVIKDWYESLSEKTKQYLYMGNENRILELMANITNDEKAFIGRLAKTVTFLRIDDWNSDTISVFLRDLRTFKGTIEDFNSKKDTQVDGTASYEIVFTDSNGNRVPKRFDKIEYSNRAKLLLNEMTAQLEEYGQSITEQEKRQVLIELLEKLCCSEGLF
jgi:hypothetical protein